MTEEEVKREEEREELIAERKARHKKFDFADFVNRDREEDKKKPEEKKGKNSARTGAKESDRTTYYSGALGAFSSKMDQQKTEEILDKPRSAAYKPPIKGGRAPR